MAADSPTPSGHRWCFFRSGGFDQVTIDRADDLRHLDELDPKLWTALACPTTGLEFDARTLALVDSDHDGQIRVPEVLAAVRFACSMLKDPAPMFGPAGLPLAAIDDSHDEGARLKAAAAKVLGFVGKGEADALVVADFADMTRLFTSGEFNGDGVATAALTADPALQRVIGEVVATQGTTADRSGDAGVTLATVTAFFEQAAAVIAWHGQRDAGGDSLRPLGDDTLGAAAALDAVHDKVEDFFARCRLAAFDPRAAAGLNPGSDAYATAAGRLIGGEDAEIAALPLAAVAAGASLPLGEGLNPAWIARMAALRAQVVAPLLGPRETLSTADWAALVARFAACRAWLAERPATALHEIGLVQLRQMVGDGTRERLAALVEQDQAADASAANIDAVERLVHYQRDLVTLLRNFVTLSDFYAPGRKAIFQTGTLYLDQRSCELVLLVEDMQAHARMAPFSGCFLVYCRCERTGSAPVQIVAALTGGSVDELMIAGRHGLFLDRQGRDWKATVLKVVEQPVSIRQAFWSPYRRAAAFVEGQIRKLAAARDKDVDSKAQAGLGAGAAAAAKPGVGPAAPPFDIAKFAGIFAAIGLAVGAIGTALAAALTGLFALSGWQLPLVVGGVLLATSGPSMLLAALTLRRRNLGPLLDANGWAVNARARINLPFGRSLTGVAELPAGSSRSLSDPFAQNVRAGRAGLLLLVLVALLVWAWRRGALAPWVGG